MSHPHKSTTTPEVFHHLRASVHRGNNGRTAFVRLDKDGQWYVSYADCDHRDQFCKKTGRVVARRKWFEGDRHLTTGPTYEEAFFPRTAVH